MSKPSLWTAEKVDQLVDLVIQLDPESYDYAAPNGFTEMAGVDSREIVHRSWIASFELDGIAYVDAEAAIREYYSPTRTVTIPDILRIVRIWRSDVLAVASAVVTHELHRDDV